MPWCLRGGKSAEFGLLLRLFKRIIFPLFADIENSDFCLLGSGQKGRKTKSLPVFFRGEVGLTSSEKKMPSFSCRSLLKLPSILFVSFRCKTSDFVLRPCWTISSAK